ncbi:MAG: hypothetical protein H6922_01810 [Pseudomonadaceae bacterium]|nr:hypothetical protein [Pseudomonadaceae bacterium]
MKELPTLRMQMDGALLPYHMLTPAEMLAQRAGAATFLRGVHDAGGQTVKFRLWRELVHGGVYDRLPALKVALQGLDDAWTMARWPGYVMGVAEERCARLARLGKTSAVLEFDVAPEKRAEALAALMPYFETHLFLIKAAYLPENRAEVAQLDELLQARGRGELMQIPAAERFVGMRICGQQLDVL